LPESVREPDVLLEGGETLFEDSLNFKGGFNVLHTPGHSAGSICLYCAAAGLLISGDTMFAGSCGRTDLTGGSQEAMKASLKKLGTLPSETVVLPGHGGSTTISDFPFGYF
ncbi:MAG: MBL fold metallo-hydrolase, partial [Spirochaetaceae bacterium]|nr:MBL fold metallo-hydrolase [Spirochaetaceae bacterium]